MATTTEVNVTNAAETAPTRLIKIKSNDDQIFEIDQGVVEQSSTIKTLAECQ